MRIQDYVIASPWQSLGPYPAAPCWTLLAVQARHSPKSISLIEPDGTRTTYEQLLESAGRLSAFLQDEAELRAGERVAVAARSTRGVAALIYAIWMADGVLVPLNASAGTRDLAHVINDSGASLIFADRKAARMIEDLRPGNWLPSLRGMYPAEDLWQRAQEVPPLNPRRRRDVRSELAAIPYSSGTSGLPKGIELTHANLIASARQLGSTAHYSRHSRILTLRVFWNTMRWIHALGATCILQPTIVPDQTLDLIAWYQVTHVLGRPSSLQALVEEQEQLGVDVSSLQLLESAASPLSRPLADRAARVFGCPIIQAYHLMEVAGAANRPRLGEAQPTLVGWPLPDTEERIVDPVTGNDAREGADGELLIRGPQVMRRYWGTDDGLASPMAEEGWLHTGDLVRHPSAGGIEYIDRLKDMIKTHDHPIAPAEVEAALLAHPAVIDAAVVPVPSPVAGELPKAFVVLAPGNHVSESELIAFALLQLAPTKQLHEVAFVSTLPRDDRGKLIRRQLRGPERSSTECSSIGTDRTI